MSLAASGEAPGDPAGRWAALVVLATALLLAMTTWFSASAVLPQLRVRWALGPTGASFLTIAVKLGFVAGAVVSAAFNFADLVPPRQLMLLGSSGAALANATLAVSGGPLATVGLRFVTGAAPGVNLSHD